MRYLSFGRALQVLLFICSGTVQAEQGAPAPQPAAQSSPMPGPPRRMLGPGGAPPQPFPQAAKIAQPKNDGELAAAIRQLGAEVAASGQFSGGVLLAVDGKPLVDEGWGESDRERHLPNKPETSYDTGSIGKVFTQIAILQLVEVGKLSLDTSFEKYLPDYPNREIADKVTVRQLLLHTSGMGDFIGPDVEPGSLRDLKDFLPAFVKKPLEFAPGSANRYSNAGYVVLGMIIEAATGGSYYDYVQRHILQPAGMTHSGFFDRTHLPATVAHSYEGGRDVTAMHPPRGSPAGGLHASTGDLLRLVQAINAGKLLPSRSVKVLRDLIPRPPNAPAPPDETKLAAYGIEGGAPGVSTQLVVDPTGRYTRVILANGSPPTAMAMGATIREWLKQMPK